jgi:hypothetical protein
MASVPTILNYWKKKECIKYAIVGDVPNNVRKECEKIEKGRYNSYSIKTLQNHFGKKFVAELNLGKSGGDIGDEINTEFSTESVPTEETKESDENKEFKHFEEMEEIEEINNYIKSYEVENEDLSSSNEDETTISGGSKSKPKSKSKKLTISVPSDSSSDGQDEFATPRSSDEDVVNKEDAEYDFNFDTDTSNVKVEDSENEVVINRVKTSDEEDKKLVGVYDLYNISPETANSDVEANLSHRLNPSPKASKSPRSIKSSEFSESDISIYSEEEERDIHEMKKQKKIKKREKEIPSPQLDRKTIKTTIVFDYTNIYMEDSVFCLKEKITMITKIPIYAQHLWQEQPSKKTLNYIIKTDSINQLDINAFDILFSTNELFENIPVKQELFSFKDNFKIESNEQFVLVENFIDIDVAIFNIVSMLDFLPSGKVLFNIINDVYKMELIYYTFIIIYFPMLTYNMWIEYIKSPDNMQYYLDINPSIGSLKNRFAIEKSLYDAQNKLFKTNIDEFSDKMENFIVESVVTNMEYNINNNLISLRNLFDYLPLDNELVWCKYFNKESNLTFEKQYNFSKSRYVHRIHNISNLTYKIMNKSVNHMYLTFYPNLTYIISTSWPIDKKYTYDDCFAITKDIVNPIIEKINKLKNVFVKHTSIKDFDRKLIKIISMNSSIIYKKHFTDSDFIELKNKLDLYQKARIFSLKSADKFMLEYFCIKGVQDIDTSRIEKNIPDITNYYLYLSDPNIKVKWHNLFEIIHLIRFTRRFNDIKIDIVNIKANEFNAITERIITCLSMIKFTQKKAEEKVSLSNKKLKMLKEIDPLLYNLGKSKKSKSVYSRKCQKQNQPIILSKEQMKMVSSSKKVNTDYGVIDKSRIVKYWNFTTNEPAYYYCPNKKYPHIKFIVKEHPKNFCIPCCRKLEIVGDESEKDSDDGKTTEDMKHKKSVKKMIYDICMKDHVYTGEKKVQIQDSKYIMSYGKDIDIGRLCKLPESSLEPLFYELFSIEGKGVEDECYVHENYYLYGTHQNTKNINKLGMLFCISHSLDMTIQDLIGSWIQYIKKNNNMFDTLLGGQIYNYFENKTKFIEKLLDIVENSDVFDIEEASDTEKTKSPKNVKTAKDKSQKDKSQKEKSQKEKNEKEHIQKEEKLNNQLPWNDIFRQLVNINKLNIILFYDNTKKVALKLPQNFSNSERFVVDELENLFVLQKYDKFYPIYLVNQSIYFKTGIIDKKTFSTDHKIVVNVKSLVSKYVRNNNLLIEDLKINLNNIESFCEHHAKSKVKTSKSPSITKYLINRSNLCYAVILNKNIYFPVQESHFVARPNIECQYEPFKRSNMAKFADLIQAIKSYNNWVYSVNENLSIDTEKTEHVYQNIQFDKWITYSGKIIGFMSSFLNYYFSDNLSENFAMKIAKVPIYNMLYNIDDVNKTLNEHKISSGDDKIFSILNINESVYYYHLYKIFLYKVSHILHYRRNKKVRIDIVHNINNSTKLIKYMKDNLTTEDINRMNFIFDIFSVDKNNNITKNQMVAFKKYFDSMTFDFDYDEYNILKDKNIDNGKLKKVVQEIMSHIIKIVSPAEYKKWVASINLTTNFTIFASSGKLQMTKEMYEHIMYVFMLDIKNPSKLNWIFNYQIVDDIIVPYRFIKRPFETIFVY